MANTPVDCSVGIAPEVTYKTYVAPTRTFEFNTESLDWEKNVAQGTGMRVASKVARSGRRVVTAGAGKGDIDLDVVGKGMGLWLAAAWGGTPTVTQIAATTAYQQVHTIGDTPGSLTVQKGIPLADGSATSAITFLGCMVESFEFTQDNNDLLKAKFSLDVGDYTTAQSLAALAYTAEPLAPFHFGQVAAKVGGTITLATTTALATSTGTATYGIRDFSLQVDNKLSVERYNQGGAGRKSKPPVGLREITGKFTAEYDQTTLRDAFLADADSAILFTWTGATISGGNSYTFQLALPVARLESGLPQANGGDLVTVEHTFTVLDGLVAAQAAQCVYVSTDTAV